MLNPLPSSQRGRFDTLHRPTATDLLSVATRAAEAAALVHGHHVGRLEERWIDEKTAASDFVSNVDLESQDAALAVISSVFPHHHVMAEEGDDAGQMDPDADFTWIIDPLDGTTNFLHNHPFYASSVAVWDREGPVAGVVHCQPQETVWTALRGGGAFENGESISVSGEDRLKRCLIGTGFPFKRLDTLELYQEQFGRVLQTTAGVRRAGAAAIDLAYLARGSLDAFWELDLNPWDFAAGVLLVEEAGGTMSRVDGSSLTPENGTVMGANSHTVLTELRQVLQG